MPLFFNVTFVPPKIGIHGEIKIALMDIIFQQSFLPFCAKVQF